MSNYNDPAGIRKKKFAVAAALATAIAIPAEGLRHWAYDDIANPKLLTVCYGTTGADVVKGKRYTIDECKAYLDRDMQQAVAYVDSCAPGLPEPVLAAFADATYNIGPKVACDTRNSTAARYLKSGQLEAACNQLPRWNKARVGGVMVALPGLTKRREAERKLCLDGV